MYNPHKRYGMNIGIITQARTSSTRLPSKVLLKIKEKTLLQYHLDRLKLANIPIYIATTTNKKDNIIIEMAEQLNYLFYRGSEQDVLSRFYHCASQFNVDIIIRVTSDCPLIDADTIIGGLDIFLNQLRYNHRLYLSNTINRTFPKGADFEIFSFTLLEEAYNNASLKKQREHVTPYFYENSQHTIKLLNFFNTRNTANLRITLDYLSDFNFIQTLIQEYKADTLSIKEIENLILNNNHLMGLNKLCTLTALQQTN